MGELIESLRKMGCDMDGAMERFLEDREFFTECLDLALKDEAFEKLKVALDAGDVEEAFNQSHTLKGLIANMGITPIYNVLVEIVELLRGGDAKNIAPALDKEKILTELVQKYIELVDNSKM